MALVTGASSGIGRATAQHLASEGFQVFGTSRQERADPEGVTMLVLDVRSDESVASCVETLLSRTGRIDLLVSNAGTTHLSMAEETSPDMAERVMDTNFWGSVRMTRAVLPTMRKQRSGQIIYTSSLAGLVGTPCLAFYAASKHALEGFAESLRLEVESFGIHVSLIEPDFRRTGLARDTEETTTHEPDYDELRAAVQAAINRGFEEGGPPAQVAECIVNVAQADAPQLRYRVGREASWVPRLRNWLPDSLFAMGVRRRFGLD